MNFSYKFPAVKGIQAGREYYVVMVPLKFLSKLFVTDTEYVSPEYRAQRRTIEIIMCFLPCQHLLMGSFHLFHLKREKILVFWK